MCPPGVDQTTRSPQHWYFLAPEVKQVLRPIPIECIWHSWHSFNLSSMIFGSKGPFDSWSLLARPIPPVSKKASCGSLGAFDTLSNELIHMIMENLDERADMIALGFSCEGFWQLVNRRIQLSYVKLAAPWAGKKIAFHGSYCYDLPKPFLEDGLLESIVPPEQFDWETEHCWICREFFWAHAEFDSPVSPNQNSQAWLQATRAHQAGSGIPPSRLRELEKEIACAELFPNDRSWVLRNLTTRETVSSKIQGSMRLRSWDRGHGQADIKFNDILMMKICWTTLASGLDRQILEVGLHRGDWAGHRFDIVTSDTHSCEENLGDWKDITRKVVKEIRNLKKLLDY